jgi:hypothetical protein
MRVAVDQALEHCMQELARTGDVEASLELYPQYADQLRPLLEVARAAHRHFEAVPEAPGGLTAGRERMLAAAARHRAQGSRAISATKGVGGRAGSRRIRLGLALRFIAIVLVIFGGIAALGGGVVWAAGDSLPGDRLYPVKLMVEDVRLALATTPDARIDLELWFIEVRTDEVEALATAERLVPDETFVRMEWHVTRVLTQAAWASDDAIAGLLERIAGRIRAQTQRLEQAQATSSPQARADLERAAVICRWGVEEAESGLDDVQAFRRRHRDQSGTPRPTHELEWMTATPRGDQEQSLTATPTPQATPWGSQMTPSPRSTLGGDLATRTPRPTPRPLQVTPEPRPTSQGGEATHQPSTTPQHQQETPMPHPTLQGPQMTPRPQHTPQGQQQTRKPIIRK